ncbi:MAG: hypothetical protein JWP97_4001 [Labilithrix sp.]|nr:hypothetical protein [Labilithrix sp.]
MTLPDNRAGRGPSSAPIMTLRSAWVRRLARLLVPSARSLRMGAYSGFAFGVLAVASGRAVYADVREVGLGMGHQLAKLEDLTGNAQLVTVNGAVVHRASAHTAQPVSEVLGRYEAYCKDSPGALGRAMSDIPGALAASAAIPQGPLARSSVVHEEQNGRGMVICFVDEPGAAARSLVQRLEDVSTSGDLSPLGHFRYAFAEPSKAGTHVVTFWSDGEINLKKMFPAEGDAPGSDSAVAPRPAGSRRTLSASVEGYPASVRIYESPAARPAVEQEVDAALRARGFTRATRSESGSAYVRKDGAEIFVSLGDAGARTAVTIVESSATAASGVRAEGPR